LFTNAIQQQPVCTQPLHPVLLPSYHPTHQSPPTHRCGAFKGARFL
jgi:hypothetical protein